MANRLAAERKKRESREVFMAELKLRPKNVKNAETLETVPYPTSVRLPDPELNFPVEPGRFRYDRSFLMQFMNICTERPISLAPLDELGLEPREAGVGYSASAHCQAPSGLGLGAASRGGVTMGNFRPPSSSRARFGASNATRPGAVPFSAGPGGRLASVAQGAGQGDGSGGPRQIKRARGRRVGDHHGDMRTNPAANIEPACILERSEGGWVAASTIRTQRIGLHQLVDRKVEALLNKLTMARFDSISNKIIWVANRSKQERDGSTLMQVIKLVFEKAKDEPMFSEIYARLCRKMMERISPDVQDETIRNSEGQPITGGMPFRKYLLNRYQEDFERGWSTREAALVAAALKSGEDKVAENALEGNGEVMPYSGEYYAAAKTKRQGLGLVRFIGELFQLQVLAGRIMHGCVRGLLSDVINPEEEEIESLCTLLITVGRSLDNPKAKKPYGHLFRAHALAGDGQG
ncbi:hypothetical protein FRC11_011932 [Ceratobasidium sp. 423]|nr:hypothetical protein FRC11_011932 [Ceratobasidium sp. 423]